MEKVPFERVACEQPCCEVGGKVQQSTNFPKFSFYSTVVHSNRQCQTCSNANLGSLNIRKSKLWSFMLRRHCCTLQGGQCPPMAKSNQESTCINAIRSRGPMIPTNCGRKPKSVWRRSTKHSVRGVSWSEVTTVPKRKSHKGVGPGPLVEH